MTPNKSLLVCRIRCIRIQACGVLYQTKVALAKPIREGGTLMSNQLEIQASKINDDVLDTDKIIQITFFDDIDTDDVLKTKWLLGKYTDMIDIIKNYEFALQQMENGSF